MFGTHLMAVSPSQKGGQSGNSAHTASKQALVHEVEIALHGASVY